MADKAEKKKRGPADGPITIKKYANRRLYNTATSSYVTLDHLAQMVRDGVEFEVFDAKSGEDITRQVLTHIIVEEEARGSNMLPLAFLRQLIGLYGDSLQAMVPGYLDEVMNTFTRNQDQLRTLMGEAFNMPGSMAGGIPGTVPGGANPFAELSSQNMAMFENAMKMFNPFIMAGAKAAETGPAGAGGGDVEMDDLRKKLDALQAQLDALSAKKG